MANLVRHVQSGTYYARIRVRGKLIWKSFNATDRISIAKLRLSDFHREERQHAAAQKAVARGKMIFTDALQTYRERLKGDHSLKERSKAYREERITALLKSWPDLAQSDVARIMDALQPPRSTPSGQRHPDPGSNPPVEAAKTQITHSICKNKLTGNSKSSLLWPGYQPCRASPTFWPALR